MINHKHKFAFVHIPRTGGTSVECFFEPTLCDKFYFPTKHRTHAKFIERYPEYFSFSFVRNPWDRLLSFYIKCGGSTDSVVDFKKWLSMYPYNTRHSMSMSDFILNRSNQPIVDFIGRYERLDDDFGSVCDKLGISPSKLPCLNSTEHPNYVDYYDEEARHLVGCVCSRDIEVFNYEFGH
tara:strand:+ start:173 stop:712 length:540 start_codon:yes stop_codon:yes gene_type:complete